MIIVIRGPCEIWFDTTCFEDIQFQESAPSLGAEHRVDYSLSFQSRNYPYTVAYRGCDPYHSGNDRKPVLRCSPLLGARMDDCGNPDCVHIVARLYCCTEHFPYRWVITRWDMAMVFGFSIRRFGLVYGLCRFGVSLFSCVTVWCLPFIVVRLVESWSGVSDCCWVRVWCRVVFPVSWFPLLHVLLHLLTQLLTVELYIMILEVTLTCILMQG